MGEQWARCFLIRNALIELLVDVKALSPFSLSFPADNPNPKTYFLSPNTFVKLTADRLST